MIKKIGSSFDLHINSTGQITLNSAKLNFPKDVSVTDSQLIKTTFLKTKLDSNGKSSKETYCGYLVLRLNKSGKPHYVYKTRLEKNGERTEK